ncbi:hypothetical protein D3C72_1559280 [compost metagenome]
MADILQHNDEFLTAISGKNVVLAQCALQKARRFLQREVAHGVAVSVVDRLEVVDIDNHHAQRRTLLVAAEDGANGLFQCAAIEDARQGVGFGELAQLLGQRSLLVLHFSFLAKLFAQEIKFLEHLLHFRSDAILIVCLGKIACRYRGDLRPDGLHGLEQRCLVDRCEAKQDQNRNEGD